MANDMEEDNQAPKQSIFTFLYGQSREQRPMFHRLRLQLLRCMGWRTRVTREECEQVGDAGELGEGPAWNGETEWSQQHESHLSPQIQAYTPELWVWSRDRANLT